MAWQMSQNLKIYTYSISLLGQASNIWQYFGFSTFTLRSFTKVTLSIQS